MAGIDCGSPPLRADRSEWHTPAAPILISTSPGPGPTTWTSSRMSSLASPTAWSTAARTAHLRFLANPATIRSKVEQVTVTPRNPQSARFAQIHEGDELSGPQRRGIQQTREGGPYIPGIRVKRVFGWMDSYGRYAQPVEALYRPRSCVGRCCSGNLSDGRRPAGGSGRAGCLPARDRQLRLLLARPSD